MQFSGRFVFFFCSYVIGKDCRNTTKKLNIRIIISCVTWYAQLEKIVGFLFAHVGFGRFLMLGLVWRWRRRLGLVWFRLLGGQFGRHRHRYQDPKQEVL